MNKEILLAKVEERESDLIELNKDIINKKETLYKFIEINSIDTLPHIYKVKEIIRVYEQIQYSQQKIIETLYQVINEDEVREDDEDEEGIDDYDETEEVQGEMEQV